jgi:hypothetical protein
MHPDLEARAKKIKVTAIAPPDVEIYSLSAGGVTELMDDWSDSGKENLKKAVVVTFKEGNSRVKNVSEKNKRIKKELEEVQALYRAVRRSIYAHTYPGGMNYFAHKAKDFNYSVGPIDKILKRYKADAMIIIYGYDEISTGGRKALKAASTVLQVFGGPGVRSGVTAVSLAVVDRKGTVLWHNYLGNAGGYDLRKYKNVEIIVDRLLAKYPGVKE